MNEALQTLHIHHSAQWRSSVKLQGKNLCFWLQNDFFSLFLLFLLNKHFVSWVLENVCFLRQYKIINEHLSPLISILDSSSVVSSVYYFIFSLSISLPLLYFSFVLPLSCAPFFLSSLSMQFKSKSGDLRGVKSWGVKHRLVLCKPLRGENNPTQSLFSQQQLSSSIITLLAASPLLSSVHKILLILMSN